MRVLNPLTDRAARDLDPGSEPVTFVLWPGFGTALALSVLTVAAGLALFHWRGRVDRALERLPVSDGAAVFDRIRTGVLDLGARVGRPDTDPPQPPSWSARCWRCRCSPSSPGRRCPRRHRSPGR